ncbi:MAG: aspartate dehydrogenase [Actinobacteria bacterium]|nr:aspartate dehydrogenase [Actinomycetota bacterium]
MRVALVGWGAIARTASRLLAGAPVEIVAVAVRAGSGPHSDLPGLARLITDPDELASTRPDVVAEAAGRESVGPWGRAALLAGADLIVSSASAFADTALLEELLGIAAGHGAHVQVHPGAIGAVDALAAASIMGLESVEHRVIKPPVAWRGTPAEDRCDLDDLDGPEVLFAGTATDAASQFPKNANVVVTTALAGVGLEATQVRLVADPMATGNRHEITAIGGFGRLEFTISGHPLPDNPKSSTMAALNLVRGIRNRSSPLVL